MFCTTTASISAFLTIASLTIASFSISHTSHWGFLAIIPFSHFPMIFPYSYLSPYRPHIFYFSIFSLFLCFFPSFHFFPTHPPPVHRLHFCPDLLNGTRPLIHYTFPTIFSLSDNVELRFVAQNHPLGCSKSSQFVSDIVVARKICQFSAE